MTIDIYIIIAGTIILLVGLPLVIARLTQYPEREHKRAYLSHHKGEKHASTP